MEFDYKLLKEETSYKVYDILIKGNDDKDKYTFNIIIGQTYCHLTDIFLHTSLRKQGIVIKLLDYLQTTFQFNEFRLVSSVSALPYWKRRGFKVSNIDGFMYKKL